jgi:hypothetical protein
MIVSKIRCIQDQNYSCGIPILEVNLGYMEICDEFDNLWTMYTFNLLKPFGFFMIGLWI